MTMFTDLGLAPLLLKALAAEGYEKPTPIQAQAITPVMEGHDLLGIAQTGTGKTAAFALPILHRLITDRRQANPKSCRVLVLSPTRELASQIHDSFRSYGRFLGLTSAAVFGGVGFGPQAQKLARGVDILIATPGRLLDHLGRGTVRLDRVETFVLDEADQMLDLGFIVPIRKLVPLLPKQRQNLFFSATMPQAIGQLAAELLHEPVRVSVAPVATPAERVEQSVILVEQAQKRVVLAELLRRPEHGRTLVFTRTKHGADRVVRDLETGGIRANAIHGNKIQNQRERALREFKSGQSTVLVATDIAARGIDVDAVTHVVNFDLPDVAETYVHRIGRTARAGATGIAIALCSHDERGNLRDIERLIRRALPVEDRRQPGAQRPANGNERAQGQQRHQGQRHQGQDGQQPRQDQGGGQGNGQQGQNRGQRRPFRPRQGTQAA
jgi:ATP-dependent RNA helicase RhlE